MRAGSEFHAAGPATVHELSARRVLVRRTAKSPQSINQSKRIYIAPYVAGESEARVGLG